MFSTVDHFQMFKPGRAGRREALQKQENQSKASNFTKQPWLEMAKEDIVCIKNMQSNKMNIIQHIA